MAAETITVDDAVLFVRTRLDEMAAQASDMLVADVDDRNLATTVRNLLRDSVEFIHRTSPIEMVSPAAAILTETSDQIIASVSDKVLDIRFKGNSQVEVLRFASLKSADSDYVVTRLVPEDSPVARMQLNKHVRGVPDNPVAVLMADSPDARPHMRYYTTALQAPEFSLRVVTVPVLVSNSYVETTTELKMAVLEHLTAEVMTVYGVPQAQTRYQMSGIYAQNGQAGPATNSA